MGSASTTSGKVKFDLVRSSWPRPWEPHELGCCDAHEFPVRVKRGIVIAFSEKTALGSRSRLAANGVARKPP